MNFTYLKQVVSELNFSVLVLLVVVEIKRRMNTLRRFIQLNGHIRISSIRLKQILVVLLFKVV